MLQEYCKNIIAVCCCNLAALLQQCTILYYILQSATFLATFLQLLAALLQSVAENQVAIRAARVCVDDLLGDQMMNLIGGSAASNLNWGAPAERFAIVVLVLLVCNLIIKIYRVICSFELESYLIALAQKIEPPHGYIIDFVFIDSKTGELKVVAKSIENRRDVIDLRNYKSEAPQA